MPYTLYAENFKPEHGDWVAYWWTGTEWVGDGLGWRAQDQPCTINPPDITSHAIWIWPAGTSIDFVCALDGGTVTVDQQTLVLTGDLCPPGPTALIFAHIPRVAKPGDTVNCEFLIRNGEPIAGDATIMPAVQSMDESITMLIDGDFHWYAPGEYKWVSGTFTMPSSDLFWKITLYSWDWGLSEWIPVYTQNYIPDPTVLVNTHDSAGRLILTSPRSAARPECWIAFVCYSNNGHFPSSDIEKNVARVLTFYRALMPYFSFHHTLVYSSQRDAVGYNVQGYTFPDISKINYDDVPKAHIYVPLWDAEGMPQMFGGSYGIDVMLAYAGREMTFNATSYNTGWNEMAEPGDGIISNFFQTIIHENFHGFHTWADYLGYWDHTLPTCGYWCGSYNVCPWCYNGPYYKEVAGEWWYQKMYDGLYLQYTRDLLNVWPTTAAQYTLTTGTVGSGTVTPSGGTYDDGTVVTLTATPASGWEFSYWTGTNDNYVNPTTVTMSSDKVVTAYFIETEDLGGLGATYL